MLTRCTINIGSYKVISNHHQKIHLSFVSPRSCLKCEIILRRICRASLDLNARHHTSKYTKYISPSKKFKRHMQFFWVVKKYIECFKDVHHI